MNKRTTSVGYCSLTQPYLDTEHWEQAANLRFVSTELMLADQAIINLAQTNRILIPNAAGTGVAAGLGGAPNGNTDYPLWIGETFENRAQAAFRVNLQGKLVASGAEISGILRTNVGYGSSLNMANLDYNNAYHDIVPEVDLCSLYYANAIRTSNNARFLRLPNPANYEGLTLKFFIRDTTNGFGMSYYFLWSDANWLYVKEGNYAMVQPAGSSGYVAVESFTTKYKLYGSAGTNVLFANNMYEFTVIGGKWYHIRGLITGE